MNGGCLPVITSCTRVKDNNNRDIILVYNQALYNDDDQIESLQPMVADGHTREPWFTYYENR